MSTPGIDDAESLATILACFDLGVNFLDTAFATGMTGRKRAVDQLKPWPADGTKWSSPPSGRSRMRAAGLLKQIIDGCASATLLRRQCEESLRRLQTDRVELYYLHAPDPQVPIAESAGEIKRFIDEGKVLSAGVSNVDLTQLKAFAAECPLTAFQPAYNMLQRDIERDTLPWCREHGVSTMVYWPLLKGLLAGHLPRDHAFAPGDSRLKYPMFQGEEWQKNQDLVDALRQVAADAERSVAQVVINWTIHQPGITSALCGAKRPDQIRDNAGAMGWGLTDEQRARIDAALAARRCERSLGQAV